MTTKTLKEYVEEHCVAIDRDMFLLMWGVIEGDEWIYLDREFIKSSLTDDKSKDAIGNFYRRVLFVNFELDRDYMKISRPGYLVQHAKANRTDYYSVTKKTFVTLLCTAKTVKSARYLSFLYELQLLVVQYYKSQYDDYKGALDAMLESQAIVRHTREQAIKEVEAKRATVDRLGVVYFMHEVDDHEHHKIGYTYNMRERISNLQVGNLRELRYAAHIICRDPAAMEVQIHEMLARKKMRGEWYAISRDEVLALVVDYAG